MTQLTLDRVIDEQKFTGLQARVILVCAAVAFCDSFSIQAVNYAAPVLRDSLGLGTGQLGAVFSIGLLGMMFGSFLIGPIGDRFGRRTPMALLTITFGLITACTVFATEFWHLIAFRLMDGLALGAALPNANVLAAEYSPKRSRRLTLGLVAIGYTVGGFLAGVVGGPLIASHGWQALFLVGGAIAVATGATALAVAPESLHTLARRDPQSPGLQAILQRIAPGQTPDIESAAKPTSTSHAPFRSLLSSQYRRLTISLWLMVSLASIVIYFFLSWTPIILRDAGLKVENAIQVTAMFNIGLVIAAVSVGWLLDRYEAGKVMLGTALFAGCALVLMAFVVREQTYLGVASMMIGAGLGGVVGGSNMVAATAYPAWARVTGAAWTLGLGRMGSVFGPSLGAVAISGGLEGATIYLWAIVPVAVVAVVACLLPKTSGPA